ncbi:zinc-dependent alcohol dehydrogenase family protein [Paenibacillus validus]|uniref:zinc-dependent alcohol dehydrogenase family protein n=1 Tax=Paenibacillus validus TaxID=44253 RepID=UPI003D28FB0F
MRAVILPGKKEVQVVDRPKPVPGDGQVLVRMRASAICRSDMSLYYGGKPLVGGEAAKTGTVIPGHEPAGDVVEIGPGVRGLQPGDRVAVYLAIGCGHCTYCLSGYLSLCSQWKCVGFDVDGGDADYMVVPAQNCLKLPDPMSYETGALLLDNMGTQYHAQKTLGVSGNDTLAIFGLGPMGSAGVLIAKARGARVIAVDVLDSRLEMAKELGADVVINSTKEDAVEVLRELTHGEGVDKAIDSSGNPAAQNAALDSVRKIGSVALIGETSATTINPSEQMIRKLLKVYGIWIHPIWMFEEIAKFVIDHNIPVDRYITHRFNIEQAAEAFRLFDERVTDKAVFVWD